MTSRGSRDRGLLRISSVTRMVAIGTVAAGGVLSVAVAKSLPGRSTASAARSSSQTTDPTTATTAPAAGSGQSSATTAPPTTVFSPPPQDLQPAYSQPVVSSGGS